MRSFLVPLFAATLIAAQRRMSGGYIVELASAPAGKRSADPHAEFIEALDRRSMGNFRTRQQYRSDLFNGIAVQLSTPEELVDLASLPNVVAVHPLYVHPIPEPINKRAVKEGEDPVLGRSVHIMTGVELAHASGIKGKGIQVAILDTGVDYNHPTLGGGFGPGFKIAGGGDLVGDDYDGYNTPVPDDDPMDCFGHGTHVAGIVGASGDNKYNMVGVAPEASVFMYKISGCRGSIGDDIIIAAITRAADEGANVISMSFGAANGWVVSATGVAASRAADRGIVVTVSAGNDGDTGLMYGSTPATGEKVISVGSVENTAIIKATFVTNAPHDPFKYLTLAAPMFPGVPADVPSTPLPVLALMPFPDGTQTSDCTDPSDLPADIPKDLSGMAIVLYGSDNFECPVLEFIQMRNPAVIMNYKNRYTLLGVGFPSILISDEDGFWLAEQSKSGNLTVTFPGPPLEDSTGAAAGLMNEFSTKGPTNELEFYPSLSAPGGDIMSTIPGGIFGVQSGTSMAAPYAAGSAALLLQAKGKSAAADVRALLQTTSQNVPSANAEGALPQTLAFQGAGLVNVFSAINAASRISPAVLTLKDKSQGWDDSYSVTIHNDGKENKTYKLAHVAAGTTVSKPANTSEISLAPVPIVSAPATVSFSKDSVTIAPGSSATIVLQFTAPPNADVRTLPFVSGWITATDADGTVLKTSYIGMSVDYSTAQVLSTSSRFTAGTAVLPAIHAGPEGWQKGPANYSIKRDTVLPQLYFGLSVPTTRLVLELINADTKLPANAKRTWSDWLPSVPGAHRIAAASAAAFPSIGPIAEFNNVLRSAHPKPVEVPHVELAAFANGTRFPEGQYRAVIRALRPFGNEDVAEDWDVQVSEQFGWIP